MKYYNEVLLPVEVPFGAYCWGEDVICPHFNNEGGHPLCEFNLWPLKTDKKGNVLKPEKCRELRKNGNTNQNIGNNE